MHALNSAEDNFFEAYDSFNTNRRRARFSMAVRNVFGAVSLACAGGIALYLKNLTDENMLYSMATMGCLALEFVATSQIARKSHANGEDYKSRAIGKQITVEEEAGFATFLRNGTTGRLGLEDSIETGKKVYALVESEQEERNYRWLDDHDDEEFSGYDGFLPIEDQFKP